MCSFTLSRSVPADSSYCRDIPALITDTLYLCLALQLAEKRLRKKVVEVALLRPFEATPLDDPIIWVSMRGLALAFLR